MDSGGAVTEAILVRDSHQSVAQSKRKLLLELLL